MSRYTTEQLPANSKVPTAHRWELTNYSGPPKTVYGFGGVKAYSNEAVTNETVRCGSGDDVTHAVINTDAHPLHRVVCYASRANAFEIARALNMAADDEI